MKNIIAKNCFIYLVFKSQFKVYEGDIYETDYKKIAWFISEAKEFCCSIKSGIIYNSTVWLPERDDELARSILIKDEEKQIALLKEKIDNHLRKIKLLKSES